MKHLIPINEYNQHDDTTETLMDLLSNTDGMQYGRILDLVQTAEMADYDWSYSNYIVLKNLVYEYYLAMQYTGDFVIMVKQREKLKELLIYIFSNFKIDAIDFYYFLRDKTSSPYLLPILDQFPGFETIKKLKQDFDVFENNDEDTFNEPWIAFALIESIGDRLSQSKYEEVEQSVDNIIKAMQQDKPQYNYNLIWTEKDYDLLRRMLFFVGVYQWNLKDQIPMPNYEHKRYKIIKRILDKIFDNFDIKFSEMLLHFIKMIDEKPYFQQSLNGLLYMKPELEKIVNIKDFDIL